jgi:hypothetical protein
MMFGQLGNGLHIVKISSAPLGLVKLPGIVYSGTDSSQGPLEYQAPKQHG